MKQRSPETGIIILFCMLFAILGSSGCIEDVFPSEGWQKDQQNAYINETFNRTALEFSGAGTAMSFHYFELYDLITDPELGEAKYLGKMTGVKVTIVYNESLDVLQNTLWGHEVDATRIVKALYNGKEGNKIGFVAVAFKYKDTNADRIMFELDASDASNFQNIWKNQNYLRLSDWSDYYIQKDAGISQYEDPDTFLKVSTPKILPDTHICNPYGINEFREVLREKTKSVTFNLDAIQKASIDNDYLEMLKQSENLIRQSRDIVTEINMIPITDGLDTIRESYIAGVENLWKAGSYFWYGSIYLDSRKIEQGNIQIESGFDKINEALEMSDLEQVNINIHTVPSSRILGEALLLNQRYEYQDPNKFNDISLRITRYGYKPRYLLNTNGETEYIEPGYGYKFIYIVVEVTHLGYRGTGSEIIKTPDPGKFSIIYRGEEIKHSTPKGWIKSLGSMYSTTEIRRYEQYEGLILFIVPYDFNAEEGYIKVNLGNEGSPVWKLS